MKFIKFFFILTCFTNFHSAKICLSEEPSNGIVDDDLILFELEMSENGYSINKSVENKIRLLTIYEKILVKRCLTEVLTTLGPSGPTKDEVCIDFIIRAQKLDPGNIVSLCVREGIDSAICKHASEKQKVKVYDPRVEEKKLKATLDEVIASKKDGERIKEQTKELETKINYMHTNKLKPGEIQAEKVRIMKKILQLNCAKQRIKVSLSESETVKPETTKAPRLIAPDDEKINKKPTPEPAKVSDVFSKMLEEHFSTPTPEVDIPESSRIYEITQRCSDYIDSALKLDPNIALAYCYKSGFYSWQCLNALRKELQGSKNTSGDNLTHTTGSIQEF